MQSCRLCESDSVNCRLILYSYNAKVHRHIPKLSALLSGLSEKLIAPLKVIIMHAIPQPEDRGDWSPDWVSWDKFLEEGHKSQIGRTPSGDIAWTRMGFDAPLWILFSSGTTGRPKCASSLLSIFGGNSSLLFIGQ
jgi:acetoacetyl-CoA synthetase